VNSLEQVLADAKEEAAILRRAGHPAQADGLERLCGQVGRTAEAWLRWLSEADAHTKSGRSIRWLRAQAPEWEAQDLAKREGKAWLFRDCIIPQRVHHVRRRAA
jgi:hypothetical protein